MKFFFCAVGLALIVSCLALECSKCRSDLCEDPGRCQYGVTRDACDCCPVCYQGPGQYCGGPKNVFGVCGKEMVCVPVIAGDNSNDPDVVGTCVQEP